MRRRLRANHNTEIPRNHVAFDTETIPVPNGGGTGSCTHRLWLGRAVAWRWEGGRATRERWHTFRSPGEFWRWLYAQARAKESLWVWAHNAGFDLSAVKVWEEIECRNLSISEDGCSTTPPDRSGASPRPWRGAICTEDPPFYLSARTRDGRSVKFTDTLNWLAMSAQSIAGLLGTVKLPMPGEGASDEDMLAYCTRDVEIVQRAVCRLLGEVAARDLGCFRFTLASQAMQLFRHLKGHQMVVIDPEPSHKELERQCYHGPRAEVYFAGVVTGPEVAGLGGLLGKPPGAPHLPRGPVTRLDLNCAYPSVMRDNPYPVAYRNTMHDLTPERLWGEMQASCACADVTVDTSRDPYPCRRPQRTFWALGAFRTQLCGAELLRALQTGVVRAVHKAQIYDQGKPFRAFVDRLLSWRIEARESGDRLGAYLAKCLANALHGKFGQRSHRWELRPDAPQEQPWGVKYKRDAETGRVETWRYIGWHPQRKCEDRESPGSSPLIAAYTVAYHREAMRAAAATAGPRDVLYEDADSLHVTAAGLAALERRGMIHPHEPGKFKIEGVADVVVYRGVKNYQWDEEMVCSGLSRKATLDAHGLWHQTDFLHVDAMLGHGRPEGPVSYEVTRPAPGPSIPGRVNLDGWVDPIVYR